MTIKNKKNKRKPTFRGALKKFSMHMDSLGSSYSYIGNAMKGRVKESLKDMESLSEKPAGDKRKKILRISAQNIHQFILYQDSFVNSLLALDTVPKSLFI